MHLGRDKKFSKRMGREYKGEERARKLDCEQGFGARQEETLRELNVCNSSGSGNNTMREEEVKAVSRAM